MQLRLTVPFYQKDTVKELGARWDLLGKFWYVPHGLDINTFRHWWPEDLSKQVYDMNERHRMLQEKGKKPAKPKKAKKAKKGKKPKKPKPAA